MLNGGWFPTSSIRLAELPSPICRDPKEKRSRARQRKRGTNDFGLKSFGSYSKLKCGAPTESPASGWWYPGAVKSLDMDNRVTKCPDSYMTARDPCSAASAAHPCPSTAFSHNRPSCSSISGLPSLTIASGFQHYFPAAASCLLFPFHPVRSLFSLGPLPPPQPPALSGALGGLKASNYSCVFSSQQGGCWARKGKDNFTGTKPPVKRIVDMSPSHLCSRI